MDGSLQIEAIDSGGNALLMASVLLMVILGVLGLSFFWKLILFGEAEIKKDLFVEGNVGIGAKALPGLDQLLFLSGRNARKADLIIRSTSGTGTNQQNIRLQTHDIARGGGLFWEDTTNPNFKTFLGRNYNGGSAIGGMSYKVDLTAGNTDTNGSTYLFIKDSDGFVGIGTTNPSALLTISKAGGGNNLLINAFQHGNAGGGLYFRTGFVTENIYNCSLFNYDHVGSGSQADGISINAFGGVSICTGANTRQERLRVTGQGNVGIRTETPRTRLHVSVGSKASAFNTSAFTGDVLLEHRGETGTKPDSVLSFHSTESTTSTTTYGAGRIKAGWETATLTGWSSAAITFQTHASNSQTWTDDMIIRGGNVGIGTTNPTRNLVIHGTAQSTLRISSVNGQPVNNNLWDAGDVFGQIQFGAEGQQLGGLRQYPVSIVGLADSSITTGPEVNLGVSGRLEFRTLASSSVANDESVPVTRMIIKGGGDVGIGTTNPSLARLHIAGGVSRGGALPTPNQWFNGNTSGYQGSTGSTITTSNTALSVPVNISLYASDYVWAVGYIASSDRRIKKNFEEIRDEEALEKIRALKPTTYQYVDEETKGSKRVFGFIAQEVGEVLPHAVSTSREVIPDIYALGSIDADGRVVLDSGKTHNLAIGDVVRIYKESVQTPEDYEVSAVGNSSYFKIKNWGKVTSRVFIYGRLVDDFHTLDKNAVFTVGVAAIQDLDRQVRTLTQRLERLENLLTER
jgi:hypothetical protein